VTLKTGPFGSAAGSFMLDPSAKPGKYGVWGQAEPVRQNGYDAYARFRVEEYRKPEFEVRVTPDSGRVRLGQPAAVTVAARYYFGGAVAGASVTYRVFRGSWQRRFHFPRPYDFLRDSDRQREREESVYRNGNLAAQGTAITGPNGSVRITFDTRGDDESSSGYTDSD
jgi:hypothetical protein